MAPFVSLAALLALLVVAAITDVRERRIPNWLTAAVVALYPAHLVLGPATPDWLAAIGVAAVALALGTLLFARDLIGGGDVKLIAGLALWAGPGLVLNFALSTALAGGFLGLLTLGYHRWSGVIQAHLAGLGWATASATANEPREASSDASPATDGPTDTPPSLPYGVAIAIGGVVVVVDLFKF